MGGTYGKSNKNGTAKLRSAGNGRQAGSYQWQAMSAETLLSLKLPETRWIIPRLVPEGLTVLAGSPKLGKSFLALFWALIAAIEGPVLFMGLEDGQRRLQDRIRFLLDRLPDALRDTHTGFDENTRKIILRNLTTVHAGQWIDKDFSRGVDFIEDWLNAHPEGRLVVVDTFARFHGGTGKGRGKNEYLETNADGGKIQQLAINHKVGIVLLTHAKKKMETDKFLMVQGSVGVIAPADTVLFLERVRNTEKGSLSVTSRDGEEYEYAATFRDCLWGFTFVEEEERSRPVQIKAPSKLDSATVWLGSQLADGEVSIADMKLRAERDGHAWETVENARRRRGDISTHTRQGVHYWQLLKTLDTVDTHTQAV